MVVSTKKKSLRGKKKSMSKKSLRKGKKSFRGKKSLKNRTRKMRGGSLKDIPSGSKSSMKTKSVKISSTGPAQPKGVSWANQREALPPKRTPPPAASKQARAPSVAPPTAPSRQTRAPTKVGEGPYAHLYTPSQKALSERTLTRLGPPSGVIKLEPNSPERFPFHKSNVHKQTVVQPSGFSLPAASPLKFPVAGTTSDSSETGLTRLLKAENAGVKYLTGYEPGKSTNTPESWTLYSRRQNLIGAKPPPVFIGPLREQKNLLQVALKKSPGPVKNFPPSPESSTNTGVSDRRMAALAALEKPISVSTGPGRLGFLGKSVYPVVDVGQEQPGFGEFSE